MMEDLDDTPLPATLAEAGAASLAGPRAPVTAREWVSPGVSLKKRILTGIGVMLAVGVFASIAVYERAMLVSTIIGAIFILGFVGYLRVVAPTPFTLRLDSAGVTRADRGAEPQLIAWGAVAKVKEERFKNGVSVSVTVYKRVGERGLHRAWVVYRDDIPDFEGFVTTLAAALPEATLWLRETIHE